MSSIDMMAIPMSQLILTMIMEEQQNQFHLLLLEKHISTKTQIPLSQTLLLIIESLKLQAS